MERHEYLVVKHTSNQKDRFTKLAQVCNQHMRTEGQPELTHFCDMYINVPIGSMALTTEVSTLVPCTELTL